MTIEVLLTAGEFVRFTVFDTFKRKKVHRSPLTFATLLGISGLICYAVPRVEGAVMLGTLLLCIGLGLPVFYFGTFFLSLLRQVRLHKLPRVVYTLTLDPTSKTIGIANEQEQITYEWKKVFHAYRGKSATYLYATPARAFILPHYYIEGGANALWQIIDKKLPAEKTSHG